MSPSVYIVQPTYRAMNGKPITHVPVFNYSINLPVLSATIPPEWKKQCCLEYCEPVQYDSDAQVVIVTSAGYDIAHALDVVRTFKERGKTVIGGANMDALSDRLMGEACDALFTGYPDPPMMRQMLTDAQAGKLRRLYRAQHANMDFPLDYGSLHGRPMPLIPVLASIGCRNRCTYCCYPPLMHGRYHLRPLERVIEDLTAGAAFGTPLAFLDANLYNNRAYLLRLCHAIHERGIHIRWGGQCTVDVGDDPEVLAAMRRAGCKLIVFGLESLRPESMTQLGKPFDPAAYERQLQGVRRAGIRTAAFFMVGMDGDTRDVFDEIGRFVDRAPIDIPYLHMLFPVPGTALHATLRGEGRLAAGLFDDFARLDPRYSVPCSEAFFRPKQMTPGVLEEGYFRLASRMTSMRRIVRRSFIPDLHVAAAVWRMNMEARRLVRTMAERRGEAAASREP